MWNILSLANSGKYIYARVPNHPNCNSRGYVLYHRIVLENYLGRLLRDDEAVHHINENGKDNRIENLKIVTWREHSKIHQTPLPLIVDHCKYCGSEIKRKTNAYRYTKNHNKMGLFCNQSCSSFYQHQTVTSRVV